VLCCCWLGDRKGIWPVKTSSLKALGIFSQPWAVNVSGQDSIWVRRVSAWRSICQIPWHFIFSRQELLLLKTNTFSIFHDFTERTTSSQQCNCTWHGHNSHTAQLSDFLHYTDQPQQIEKRSKLDKKTLSHLQHIYMNSALYNTTSEGLSPCFDNGTYLIMNSNWFVGLHMYLCHTSSP